MSATMEVPAVKRGRGGMFLLEDLLPADVFTPEDFTPEQKQIGQMTKQFAEEKILTQVAAIEAKDFSVSRQLMRELGDLGLLGVDVPEEYGGLELDKVTSTIIVQNICVMGSFAVTFNAHTCIGTLPIAWYGTPEQKAAYLPKLASGEWIAGYALSESSAGSDAMNIRTRATLSEDGKHYLLNGEKMWISNAGFADLFTIFAKIDGEKFSAFLVPAGTTGLTIGSEEHKLGIRGSSTCPLILNDCKVPVENLLGTAGKGHLIAFNILNVGRYKLGANMIGSAKQAFRDGIRYAKDRVGFGRSIVQFGLVKEKIADSAAAIYAIESAVYRVVGAIDAALAELDRNSPTYYQDLQKRIEEFAAECSILKFQGSELGERVVDQMLQLHGGYGYVEEFPAERQYRDVRINKIFEGTNEINRIITTTWMMKRAQAGALPLMLAIQKLMEELPRDSAVPQTCGGPLAAEKALLASAKKIALFCTGLATEKFAGDLPEQQEVMGAIAEILGEVLVLESTLLRTEKMEGAKPLAINLARYYAARSFRMIEASAERVLGAVAEGDDLTGKVGIFSTLTRHEPVNTVGIGREIVATMVEAGQYSI
jgi:alkylation response protein AidB-like acyl-CoA dehydrogenase